MKICVLVTTMHQKDLSIYKKMNLSTDAIIANQCDSCGYLESMIDGHIVKMISTNTRGLSRNRNIALSYLTNDYDLIIFSDDDLVFDEDYKEKIESEFEKKSNVDVIKFNIHDLSSTRKISMKRITKYEKCTRRNMSSSGVCGLAIKQSCIIKNKLHFHENFGAGTENFCGEDTIFLQEIINKKIIAYRSPVDIAGIDQTESTWFKGYDEKYFKVTGMIFATIYPKMSRFLAIRSSYRFSKNKKCSLSFFEILKCYNLGISLVKKNK